MFLLPVGHEKDTVRRLPWVSIAIGSLCLLFFVGTSVLRGDAEEEAARRALEAMVYYAEHPYLEADEDLLFADLHPDSEPFALPTFGDPWPSDSAQSGPSASRVAREQAELDRLTAAWKAAVAATPERTLGLIPASVEPLALLTHMFTHAGWLHLLGNLFFFWLLAPPLEDVWGRPIFAVFYLAAGLTAGLLWVARYPNSNVPIIGASGAIAGLMGAFMVRFWRSKIKFVYALWFGLRVYFGSFKAPAWLMFGLWFAREVGMATLVEPHVSAGGGVAIWAHVYGFAFGVLGAAVVIGLRVEQRWIHPKIVAITGEIENPGLEKAILLEDKGRHTQAWDATRREIAEHPENWDAVLFLWDLAIRQERENEAAPHFMRAIRHEAGSGQMELAWMHWEELRQRLPDLEPPAALELALAEGLLDDGWSRPQIADLVDSARAKLGESPPPGLAIKLARVAARAGYPEAPEMCARLAADPNLPEAVREELRSFAEGTHPM